ncbi:nucleotidyltransferase domain-containing protein [Cellulomonas oligotrophica]|uniref:Putative nucleotidyltransferase n=1 Tax=Cellulomonas oligotrophica TaxID=931536 RepID=A0A7Y9FHD2_9CELL|nr:nucleotidyltransferase domain-containing protein [Cellulomonas oligotrophica]NYD86947.1 putative nucleotidyltransferase [Cellulomonas oligotrophica]GIG32267.1 hypothetical protein Col01nite_14260 [Cellulomonas oligotrophica]
MDLNDPITTVVPTLEGRVLQVLARTDLPLSGSRVASLIPSASNAGVRVALGRLVDGGIVMTEAAPPAVLYVANRRHLLWDAVERLVRATDGAVGALAARLAAVVRDVLGEPEASATTLALFGSTARGDNRPGSDIDLLLVHSDAVGATEQADRLVSSLIEEAQAATGNETNVYAASRGRIDRLIEERDPMVESWVADARPLFGPDVLRRLRGGSWPAS